MPKTTQTPASVLTALMEEYQLNPFSLSKEIKLSASGVRQIVTGKSKISVPTALRLAKFFGQTPVYWLNLQMDADLGEAGKDKELTAILKDISKVKKPAAKAKSKPAAKAATSGKAAAGKGKKAVKAKRS